MRKLGAALLASAVLVSLSSVVRAQGRCEIDVAQRLFGQHPPPTTEVGRLLTVCEAEGSTDYRVFMLKGVIARDDGNRQEAIEELRKAHEMAPKELNPALELAYTLEMASPKGAQKVYEEVLARDPTSRPALLGLARIARARSHLGVAYAIYEQLLAVDPHDPGALNGMAWLALARGDESKGRSGFEHVLELDPSNEEAKIGLSKSQGVYRYLFETSGIMFSTNQGTSWGSQVRGTARVSPADTLELGWRHYSNELPTVSQIGLSALPSDDITVGYHRLEPFRYGVSLVYDYRGHDDQPTEHWIDGSATFYLTDRLQWSAAYRKTFGDARYRGRLLRTGLSADVTPSWQLSATVYNSQQVVFQNGRDLWSGLMEVSHTGPRNLLFNVGVGATPKVANFHVHARTAIPVKKRIAVQLIANHDSQNAATSVTVGLVFTR